MYSQRSRGARTGTTCAARSKCSHPRRGPGTSCCPSRAHRSNVPRRPRSASPCCAAKRRQSRINSRTRRARSAHTWSDCCCRPRDAETTSHLWRLARVIGKYRDADKTPKAEPPPAMVQPESAFAEAQAAAGPPAPTAPKQQRFATQPIGSGRARPSRRRLDTAARSKRSRDGGVGHATPGRRVKRPSVTSVEVKIETASELTPENTTMHLSNDEIARMTLPGRPPVPAAAKASTSKLPPPPPRPPQILPSSAANSARMRRPSGAPPPLPGLPRARKPQAPVRRPPLPTLPIRAFETPWEELAVAYESLPAPDAASRLRWLYRAAEVWEAGAKDMSRAFDALSRAFAQARRTPQGDADVRARLHRIAQEHKAWGPPRRPVRRHGGGRRHRCERRRSADGGCDDSQRAEAAARSGSPAAPHPRHVAE